MELFYNPERMSEAEIRETFIAHQWLVDELISIIKRQPKGAGIQHAIIVAPRGMGKTTVLLMLRFTVLASELARSWQPLLFPEESYDIYDLADFWLSVLGHIAAETGNTHLEQEAAQLKDKYRHSRELEEAALAGIKDWQTKNKKRLLLLVDSFDLILAQIGDERDNARLRDVLMNEDAVMLVGGATAFFKEARAYEQPLYNLFKIYNLQSLTSDQIHELLRRRAKLDNIEDFEKTLRVNATRLRVLEYFTGGNPRLVMMLYRVLTHSQISEIKRGLEKLLDEVTPYYKAKVESLPAQQRKILDHIARITAHTREGLTPTEIASSTRLPVNQVSAQLQRLTEAGYVRAANIRSRSSYYTLSEPLYAIWHQMRFGRDARKRMEWLVTFLKGWYDAEELDSECRRLASVFDEYLITGRLGEARDVLEHRRYLASAIGNGSEHSRTVESIILSYLELKDLDTVKREILAEVNPTHLSYRTQLRLMAAGLITTEELPTAIVDQVAQKNQESRASVDLARAALRNNDLEEGMRSFRRALELDPTSLPALGGIALLQMMVGDFIEAQLTLEKAEPYFAAGSPLLVALQAFKYAVAADFENAENNLNKLEGEVALLSWDLAGRFFNMGLHYNEALKAFSQVISLDSENFDGWYQRALTLHLLERDKEALTNVDSALQIRSDSSQAHELRGLLLDRLGRVLDAVSSFESALTLSPKSAEVWFVRGLSLMQLNRNEEALESFQKAFNLQPDYYEPLLFKSLVLASLTRHGEVVKATDAMLKIDPNSFDALYLRGLSLLELNKYQDAVNVLRKAFNISSDTHRTMRDTVRAISIEFLLRLTEEKTIEARQNWLRLRQSAEKELGEAGWFELASSVLHTAATLGQRNLVRELITESDLEEPLFPLARALDYLSTKDEVLIEKLSPEVRRIVEEIIGTLQKSSGKRAMTKRSAKKSSRRK